MKAMKRENGEHCGSLSAKGKLLENKKEYAIRSVESGIVVEQAFVEQSDVTKQKGVEC